CGSHGTDEAPNRSSQSSTSGSGISGCFLSMPDWLYVCLSVCVAPTSRVTSVVTGGALSASA
ncbi:hypothetical protein, partial [Acinetobacter baumannii]|uniref:hypothetical protein n=1 Tax=Acinetobacter baumannii TaxID=470 RepID=UPI001A7F0DD1